jgi:hypothetical protein
LPRLLQAALMAAPLLFLLVDFLRVPVLLNGCAGDRGDVTLRALMQTQAATKGTFRGHEVLVSLDAIQDSHYLNFIKSKPTALVIAVDHEDPSNPYWGGLARAVLRKFDAISPADAATLRSIVVGRDPDTGHVLSQPLHISSDNFAAFPVDRLYIVGVKALGSGEEPAKKQQAEILQDGLTAAMKQADQDHIANLIIPCIGVDPNDQKTLQAREFFPLVFASLQPSRYPTNVYLSVYLDWSDLYRSDALKSIQSSWTEACENSRKESILMHERLRLLVAALFVCLIASSRHVKITLKNFLIIAAGFLGIGYGAMESANFFVQGWDAGYRLAVNMALLFFLAAIFPFLSKWNPNEIFDKKQAGTP